MSSFEQAELNYLQGARLGRIATSAATARLT
jgi:hypothetical protein